MAPRRAAAIRDQPGTATLGDHLVAAADSLLDDGAIGQLTTRQIARRAGVSDGVLYNHFPDKASLVLAALVRRYGRVYVLLSEDEQNSHRALAPTLGNLTLLEQPLTERSISHFPVKRADAYARSAVPATRGLADERVERGGDRDGRSRCRIADLVRIWARPALPEIDDDGLTPILDAVRRRGWPTRLGARVRLRRVPR